MGAKAQINKLPGGTSGILDIQTSYSAFKANLIEAMRNISGDTMIIIALYYFEEMSEREIAGIMNMSEERVARLHKRGLDKLGKKIYDSPQ